MSTGKRGSRGDVCEIPDDGACAPDDQGLHVREAVAAARVHDDLVSVLDERLRRKSSEAVGRTGDEDARHRVA
jgi:hypothetical protein